MMNHLTFLHCWLTAGVRRLSPTLDRRHRDTEIDGDAGMTTLEILLWCAIAVVVVGGIAAAIYAWLQSKSDDVTQK